MIRLERTSYTYDDKCSRKRLDMVQKRLKEENVASDEKLKAIFDKIAEDMDSDNIWVFP